MSGEFWGNLFVAIGVLVVLTRGKPQKPLKVIWEFGIKLWKQK